MVAVFLIVLHCRKMNDAFVSPSRKYKIARHTISVYLTESIYDDFVISLFLALSTVILCIYIYMDGNIGLYLGFEVYQLNGKE